jgi:tape measure domain-containing protein
MGNVQNSGQAVGRAMGMVSQSIDQVGRSVSGLNGGLAEAAVRAGAITAGLVGTKVAIEGIIGKFSTMFDQLVQARKGFNSLIGERAGGVLIAEIQQFAKDSPFVTQELVNYSQQLLGVGKSAESIVPLLKDTGNIIASVGGDTQNLSRVLYALTQIQTVGRLTGQDAMQLQASLVPITTIIAEYLGKTTTEVKKLQEQGAISADIVFAALSKRGKQVEGAMDGAVNTISGARSVLEDTISIMKTGSPVLQGIYDDIVTGIQGIAARLADPEIEARITSILEGVGQAYEAVKPVIESFVMVADSVGTSGLTVIGSFLNGVGTTLNAIPESVMRGFGALLAGIMTLKAPLFLFRYVESLKKLSDLLSPQGVTGVTGRLLGTSKAIDDTGNAAARSTGKLRAYVTELNKVRATEGVGAAASNLRGKIGGQRGMMAGVVGLGAAGFIGGYLDDESRSTGTQQAGAALSGAAAGAAMGAIAGPWGAAAGGAIGAMVGFLGRQKELAKKHREEMKNLGAETAIEYMNAQGTEFTGFGGRESALGKMAELQRNRAELESKQFSLVQITEGENAGYYKKYENKDITDQITQLDGQIAEFKKVADATLSEREALAKVANDAGSKLLTMEMPGGDRMLKNNTELIKTFEMLGYTTEEFLTKTSDQQVEILRNWEGMTTAAQAATFEANNYNSALKAAKDLVTGAYSSRLEAAKSEVAQLQATQSALTGMNDAALAVSKARKDGKDTAIEEASYELAQLTLEQQLAIEIEMRYGTSLSETAKQQRLANEMATARAAAQEQVNRATMAATIQTEAYASKILKLAGLANTVDNQKIAIDIALNNYERVVAELNALWELAARGPGNGGISPDQGDARRTAKNAKLAALAGNVDPNSVTSVGAQNDLINQINKAVSASVSGGGGGGGGGGGASGPSFQDQVESAGESLRNSIEQAMDAVMSAADAWKSGIKEATQYETAVSASRALRNTNRQIADLKFVNDGIAQLKARGLSEAALQALDINSITDARQIRKLLRSDPAQLNNLSAAVAERDAAAERISAERNREESRRTITEAIIAAAGILGYKITQERAREISAEFNITSSVDSALVADNILSALTGGRAR